MMMSEGPKSLSQTPTCPRNGESRLASYSSVRAIPPRLLLVAQLIP